MLDENIDCGICAELVGSDDSRVATLLNFPAIPKIEVGTSKYAVLPSLGPLVLGHTLVVSREHLLNIGGWGLGHEGGELEELLIEVRSRICENEQKTCLVFEHGSTSPGLPKCSTDHAHMHVLPLDRLAANETLRQFHALGAFHTARFSLSDMVGETCHFLIAFLFNGALPHSVSLLQSQDLPSQTMRRLVAQALGRKTWDWRDDLALETFTSTAALLSEGPYRHPNNPSETVLTNHAD